jgi:hypothetical protein
MATRVAEGSVFHIRWSAVFGGAFVAMGLLLLFQVLGLAAGLSAINPNETNSFKAIGFGVGIWSIVAPILSLFGGALVTARLAGPVTRGIGALHGAVLWGLTSVAAFYLAAMAVGAVVRTGAEAAAGVAQGVGQAARAAGAGNVATGALDQVLGPINQRLRAQGSPTVTSGQVQAATQDVLSQAARGGTVDRNALISALTRNTNLSRVDAATVADEIEGQISGGAASVRQGGISAAKTTGGVLWVVFGSLLLSLAAALIGAALGVSQRQRWEAAHTGLAETPELPVRPIPTGPGEPPRVTPPETGRH